MSYLVDALRKAELERHQGAAPGVAALSGRLPGTGHAGPGVTGWIVVLLVVCNVALFSYLLWPQANHAATGPNGGSAVMQRPSPTAAAATTGLGDRQHAVSLATDRRQLVYQTVAAPAGLPARTGAERATARMAEQGHAAVPPVTSGLRTTGTPVSIQTSRGRAVTPATTKPPRSEVPEVEIHGHLYSASRNESFILVNGRMYHEGDRLPDGVVVVRIDREGALLNYRGRHFYVDAPG